MPPPTITTRASAGTLAVMGRLSRLGGRAPGDEEEALGAHDRLPARVHTGDQEVDAPAVGAAPGLPHLDHLAARRDHLPRPHRPAAAHPAVSAIRPSTNMRMQRRVVCQPLAMTPPKGVRAAAASSAWIGWGSCSRAKASISSFDSDHVPNR